MPTPAPKLADPVYPEAILFDWDNTLVDTWPVIHEANARLFAYMGLTPWTFEETKSKVRRSMRETFPELFGDRWEEARDVFFETYNKIHLDWLTPITDAAPTLETLSSLGIPLGIVSNKNQASLEKEVAHLGWQTYFKTFVGAGTAARDKPDPVHADFALDQMGLTATNEVWYIGDADVDMTLASRASLYGVLVTEDKTGDTWRKWAEPPALTCESLTTMCETVLGLGGHMNRVRA